MGDAIRKLQIEGNVNSNGVTVISVRLFGRLFLLIILGLHIEMFSIFQWFCKCISRGLIGDHCIIHENETK